MPIRLLAFNWAKSASNPKEKTFYKENEDKNKNFDTVKLH